MVGIVMYNLYQVFSDKSRYFYKKVFLKYQDLEKNVKLFFMKSS